MLRLRRADERGFADHGWLRTYHTFSFADYHDPAHMGFRALRVLNDDRVAAGAGFPTHPHRDMEILSFVVEGALEHRDSMGTGSVVRAGDVQRMTAGTGVRHSEFNHSKRDALRFLQVWIFPDRKGHPPGYEQRHFDEDAKRGRLKLVASPDGRDESVSLHRDVAVYASVLAADETVRHEIAPGRHAWLQVVWGDVRAADRPLSEGDGLAVSEESGLELRGAGGGGEVLLFDLE